MKRWYALQTLSRLEFATADKVRAAGFEAIAPGQWTVVGDGRRRPKRKVRRPLFPCYVMTRFDILDDAWGGIIRACVAGTHFVTSGGFPAPALDAHWNELHAILDAEGMLVAAEKAALIRHHFTRGQVVQVRGGPFENMHAIYDGREADRIFILMNIFGRDTRVTVSEELVEP